MRRLRRSRRSIRCSCSTPRRLRLREQRGRAWSEPMSTSTVGPPTPLRLTARAADVVSAARVLLEREGLDGLTMRRLADDLDMRAPSIYKHLAGKHAIEVALIEVALAEMGHLLRAAVVRWDA